MDNPDKVCETISGSLYINYKILISIAPTITLVFVVNVGIHVVKDCFYKKPMCVYELLFKSGSAVIKFLLLLNPYTFNGMYKLFM